VTEAHSGGTTRIEVSPSAESNGTLKNLEGRRCARGRRRLRKIHSKRPPQTIVSLVKHLEAQDNELVSWKSLHPRWKMFYRNDRKEVARLTNFATLTRMRIQLTLRNRMFLFSAWSCPSDFSFSTLESSQGHPPSVSVFSRPGPRPSP